VKLKCFIFRMKNFNLHSTSTWNEQGINKYALIITGSEGLFFICISPFVYNVYDRQLSDLVGIVRLHVRPPHSWRHETLVEDQLFTARVGGKKAVEGRWWPVLLRDWHSSIPYTLHPSATYEVLTFPPASPPTAWNSFRKKRKKNTQHHDYPPGEL